MSPEAPSSIVLPLNNAWSRSRIETWLQGGISASALNTFIDCPLDFYFKYIAKIGEPDELEESISDAEMGSLVHLVLERFYGGFIDGYPSADDFDAIIQNIDQWLDDAIAHSTKEMDLTTGDNALVRGIAKKMLLRYLEFEKRTIEQDATDRCVIGVEVEFNFVLDPSTGLRMRGKIDRLERVGQSYRVLDYKTGKVEDKDYILKPKKNAPLFPGQSAKMMQIITYMLAVPHIVKDASALEAGFISFRYLDKGWCMFDAKQANDWENAFVAYVNELTAGMLSMEQWDHRLDAKYCSYCQILGLEHQPEDAQEVHDESADQSAT